MQISHVYKLSIYLAYRKHLDMGLLPTIFMKHMLTHEEIDLWSEQSYIDSQM